MHALSASPKVPGGGGLHAGRPDMSPYEIVMLLCFGAAWPFSIAHSWRARATRGKSVTFLWIVLIGYLAGILHKLTYQFDRVVYLYALNAAMVAADTLLYYRNARLERPAPGVRRAEAARKGGTAGHGSPAP